MKDGSLDILHSLMHFCVFSKYFPDFETENHSFSDCFVLLYLCEQRAIGDESTLTSSSLHV